VGHEPDRQGVGVGRSGGGQDRPILKEVVEVHSRPPVFPAPASPGATHTPAPAQLAHRGPTGLRLDHGGLEPRPAPIGGLPHEIDLPLGFVPHLVHLDPGQLLLSTFARASNLSRSSSGTTSKKSARVVCSTAVPFSAPANSARPAPLVRTGVRVGKEGPVARGKRAGSAGPTRHGNVPAFGVRAQIRPRARKCHSCSG
jgi:hypothetical protein